MNSTLQKFILDLVEKLKQENKFNDYHDIKEQIDIPFIISTLSQSFKNNEGAYKEFISDIEDEYSLFIKHPDCDYYYEIVYVYIHTTNNNYELRFFLDERLYGYCDCTPDMPDYREDKQCCGHGCDATFCSFTLNKMTEITRASWQGDAHDYWEFEDSFYKNEQELLKEEERRRKESEIENLKNDIEYAKEKLAELEREYYEDRID